MQVTERNVLTSLKRLEVQCPTESKIQSEYVSMIAIAHDLGVAGAEGQKIEPILRSLEEQDLVELIRIDPDLICGAKTK